MTSATQNVSLFFSPLFSIEVVKCPPPRVAAQSKTDVYYFMFSEEQELRHELVQHLLFGVMLRSPKDIVVLSEAKIICSF